MKYYIADCHFSHGALNVRMDNRGFTSIEEMDEYMVKQWNSRVHKNDEVVILGDFSFAKAERTMELLRRLKGKKTLMIGNHDKYLMDQGKAEKFDRSLFERIEHYLELNDNDRKVILCHYPIFCYNGQNRLDANGNPRVYMLHGHVHATLDQELVDSFVEQTKEHTRMIGGAEKNIPCEIINCFCKYSDYVPLTLDEWVEVNKQRKKAKEKEG